MVKLTLNGKEINPDDVVLNDDVIEIIASVIDR